MKYLHTTFVEQEFQKNSSLNNQLDRLWRNVVYNLYEKNGGIQLRLKILPKYVWKQDNHNHRVVSAPKKSLDGIKNEKQLLIL